MWIRGRNRGCEGVKKCQVQQNICIYDLHLVLSQRQNPVVPLILFESRRKNTEKPVPNALPSKPSILAYVRVFVAQLKRIESTQMPLISCLILLHFILVGFSSSFVFFSP